MIQASKRTGVIPESYPSRKKYAHLFLSSAYQKLGSRSWKLTHHKGARPTHGPPERPARLRTGSEGGLWGLTLIWEEVSRGPDTSQQISSRWEALSWEEQAWALKKHLYTQKKAPKNTTALPLLILWEPKRNPRYERSPKHVQTEQDMHLPPGIHDARPGAEAACGYSRDKKLSRAFGEEWVKGMATVAPS